MIDPPHPLRLAVFALLGWFARDSVQGPPPLAYEVSHEVEFAECDCQPAPEPLSCPLVNTEACEKGVETLVIGWSWERECFLLGLATALAAVVVVLWVFSCWEERSPRKRRARLVITRDGAGGR